MSETDLQLLERYNRQQAEDAFAEIVRRHLDLVYSAALRQVRSPQLAEEVAQSVFADLARSAGKLRPDTILSAWLYQVTGRTAIDLVRHESRRQLREQIASEMTAMNAATSDWTNIEPLLDEAMTALDESDRAAVLLRYFENKSLREVGAALGTSDDAAQKRVSRAVERLRQFLSKRGVTVGASGLVAIISANAVQAAPIGLAVTISAAAIAVAGTTLATIATVTATKAIAMTALQKTLVTGTVAILAAVGFYEARQASHWRDAVQSLQLDQTPMMEQMGELKAENERLAKLVAQNNASNNPASDQLAELLRLRNRAGASSREVAALKDALTQQPAKVPEILTQELDAFIISARDQERRYRTNYALNRLNRLSTKAGLSAEQKQSVREIFLGLVEPRSELELARVTGDLSLDEINRRKSKFDEEEERILSGLLTPKQLADYRQLQADNVLAENKSWLASEIRTMKDQMKLTDEQAGRASSILIGLKPGEGGPGITYYSNAREQLETRLRALEPVLDPQQLRKYRQMKVEDIEEHERIPKIIQALKK